MENDINKNIEPVLIQDEMKYCYLDYAMSVIIGRALPDARDGIKPVHRRVLYAMYALNNYHNKPYLKSARVVGDVIGKYHPHGDSAVYNTIVRLAQDFSMRYLLVDGQGNFGSIDGDAAAAMRYTEIRMKKISEEMLRDIDKETINWVPNYDDSFKEPSVLPTRIPNLLVNGSSGIAVGMSTNIPPHNITEVMKGLKLLLNKPDITVDELMEIIPGPDFPTGGFICGVQGIRSAYKTGKGIIKIKGKSDIEVLKDGREKIIITELPYQVNKAKFIERVAELVNLKHITGISDIRDESSREGIRICLDLKKGSISSVVLNQLLKHTPFQSSFGIIFLSLVNSIPRVMDIKEQLNCFLEHRREIVIKRTLYDLKKSREKAHILEGLKISIENLDAVIILIKESKNPSEAKKNIKLRYNLSDIQSQAILDMRLQKLTGLERDKIIEDYNKVIEEIEKLQEILDSENKIKRIINDEFTEIIDNYGDNRRTKIIPDTDEIQVVDLIKEEEAIVTITHNGYIKRMHPDTYKTQKRGGVGVKGSTSMREGDFYTHIFMANTHSMLYFFTDKGKVLAKEVFLIPEAKRTSNGRNLMNFLEVTSEEKIKGVVCIHKNEELDGKYLIFATEKGLIKKTKLSEYKSIRKKGMQAIKINGNDSLLTVQITNGEKDILLCSSEGKIIRFAEKDCRPIGRVCRGVKGIEIDTKDRVIGMEIIDDTMEILSVTENGYGKRTKVSQYRKQSRGGKGIIAMKLNQKTGNIASIKPVTDKYDLMVVSNKGQVVRIKVSDISLINRTTQGVKLVTPKQDEKVVAVEKVTDDVE